MVAVAVPEELAAGGGGGALAPGVGPVQGAVAAVPAALEPVALRVAHAVPRPPGALRVGAGLALGPAQRGRSRQHLAALAREGGGAAAGVVGGAPGVPQAGAAVSAGFGQAGLRRLAAGSRESGRAAAPGRGPRRLLATAAVLAAQVGACEALHLPTVGAREALRGERWSISQCTSSLTVVRANSHTSTHAHMYMYIYTYTQHFIQHLNSKEQLSHTYTYTATYTHKYTRIHVHMHVHTTVRIIRTDSHTYTQTYTNLCFSTLP